MVTFFRRLSLALRAFYTILIFGRVPADAGLMVAVRQTEPAPKPDPAPVRPGVPERDVSLGGAVQMLALLQRDGRLVDFLMEDLKPYPDAQVGAAARDVHAACRQVLERYLTLEAVLAGKENQPVTLDATVDPAAIRLIGNVGTRPPFHGILRHAGWRLTRVELPPLPNDSGRAIVSPAEVEIS
jgi:Domain of unknown function (DUF2760)